MKCGICQKQDVQCKVEKDGKETNKPFYVKATYEKKENVIYPSCYECWKRFASIDELQEYLFSRLPNE